jgi:hypothetical protein
VYEILGVVDFFILNTIETLTGENPVVASDRPLLVSHAGHDYRFTLVGQRSMRVERDGVEVIRYRQEGDRIVIEDAQGRLLKIVPASQVYARQGSGAQTASLLP